MKHTLPWHVTGIPPEAREIARAAALREGISVGDWLTRRIIAERASVEGRAAEPAREKLNPQLAPSHASDEDSQRMSDDLAARLARAEAETDAAIRRIDDVLRAVTNRLETNERSQNEVHRAMSSAASEISAATRDQAQAFQHLTRRLEQVERQTDTGALRDAVRALHQGLSRLADQIAKNANESNARVTTLAGDVEALAGEMAVIRGESKEVAEFVESRLAALDERILQGEEPIATSLQLEKRLSELEERLQRNEKGATRSPRLEDSMAKLEAGINSAEQRLEEAFGQQFGALERNIEKLTSRLDYAEQRTESDQGLQDAVGREFAAVERNIQNLASRLHHAEQQIESDQGVQDALKALSTRIDATEKTHREVSNALRGTVEETSKRLQTIEMAMPLGDSLPPSVASIASSSLADFDPPPRFEEEVSSAADLESSGTKDAFVYEPHSSAENYLAQARRAAQAAGEDVDKRSRTRGRSGSGDANDGLDGRSRRFSRAVAVAAALLLVLAAGFLVTRNVVRGQEEGRNRTAAAPATVASLERAPASPLSASPAAGVSLPQNIVPPAATPAHESATPLTRAHPATSPGSESENSLTRLMAEAKGGDAKAALVLGMKYADGDGAPVNDTEAARWLQKAAEAGEPVAQYRLGTLYEKGRGVIADHRQAIRWYSEAAKRGNRKAMHNLAVAYADGAGTQRNFSEAARWFRAAAELGLTDSQFNLAVLYERGLGVKPSLSEAYKWYAIAAAAGDTESKARLEALASQIPAADREGADKTAKAYRPQPLNVAANDGP